MEYDLRILSDKQSILDKKILTTHNLKSNETINERILAFMVELGELANETRCFKFWSLKQQSSESIVLEEYVDGIHFLTSLANELQLEIIFNVDENQSSLTKQFSQVYYHASKLSEDFSIINLKYLYEIYLSLGLSLGFDSTKIISAYHDKNQENHKRQEQGY